MISRRLEPDARRAQLLEVALGLAAVKGYRTITRDDVAQAARVSAGLVNRYFSDMDGLRIAIMSEAVRVQRLEVVAQGLAGMDKIALGAPEDLKLRAALRGFATC